MDSLPNEIFDNIFRLLTPNDLLNIRILSKKWNTFSLEVFNCSNLNIGFRNNDEVIDFCKMMKKNTCGLKFQKFFLRLNVVDRLWPNERISFFYWTQLYNEISSYVTEYYFFITGNWEEQSKIINMILNNAPNLRILHIRTHSNFPKPNFNPLKKVEVLQLERYDLNSYEYPYLQQAVRWVDLEIVTNWIEKVPSLKKIHCQFRMYRNSSSEMSKYFQYLQRVPEVSMYVYLYKDHENLLNELSLIPITKLHLEIANANRVEIGPALNLFLKKQSGRLQYLHFGLISEINNLLLPSLPKLETFAAPHGNFLTFDPKNFISLRKLMIETLEVKPFIGEVYPTVTKLVVSSYSIQNWRNIFPNLRKFTTFFYDYSDLEMLKHLLANLPTDHHLKLQIQDLGLIKYLIVNPVSVVKLEIYLHDWDSDDVVGVKEKLLWNTLTGNARIEHDSILCIEGVNNIGIPQEMGIQPSILNIKNLYKLRVWLGFGGDEFLKSISFLSQQKESFKALKKLIITLNGYDYEHKPLYKNLRKLSTWNFNTEIRNIPAYRINTELTFSREKKPEMMMYNTYNNYKKYAVKYVV